VQRRILVLGANGFIGQALIKFLRASEDTVAVAGVRAPVRQPLQGVNYRIVHAVDAESVNAALTEIDAVVNCVSGAADEIVSGARILFDAARRCASKPRIVYLSSMAVYGDASGLVGETAPLVGNLGPYSAAKVAAEQLAASYPDTFVLRPGCVYGPGSVQWSTRFALWLLSRRLGDLGAQGDGYCNLVHVQDVVEAIVRCLAPSARPAIFNLSLPEPPTWNEYLVWYGRALGAVPIRRIGQRRLMIESRLLAAPLKIAEIGFRMAKLRIALPPPLPSSLLRLMRQEIRLDVQQAEQRLRMHWTPLEDGIEETAHWFLSSQHR
jgi:nucleoside-diphosphate-sugar epimerase